MDISGGVTQFTRRILSVDINPVDNRQGLYVAYLHVLKFTTYDKNTISWLRCSYFKWLFILQSTFSQQDVWVDRFWQCIPMASDPMHDCSAFSHWKQIRKFWGMCNISLLLELINFFVCLLSHLTLKLHTICVNKSLTSMLLVLWLSLKMKQWQQWLNYS